jgi:hypothetical protein
MIKIELYSVRSIWCQAGDRGKTTGAVGSEGVGDDIVCEEGFQARVSA